MKSATGNRGLRPSSNRARGGVQGSKPHHPGGWSRSHIVFRDQPDPLVGWPSQLGDGPFVLFDHLGVNPGNLHLAHVDPRHRMRLQTTWQPLDCWPVIPDIQEPEGCWATHAKYQAACARRVSNRRAAFTRPISANA